MDGAANDPKVAEALGELQQYLSDAISPLVAADSIAVLLTVSPDVVANEIRSWTTSQHRRLGASVPISDYLYHAVRKLFMMGEFTLVSKEAMASYLGVLEQYLMALCPPEDRELLRENLSHLGDVRADLTAPVASLQRLHGEEAAPAGGDAAVAAKTAVHASQQFAQIVERLARIQLQGQQANHSASAREDVFSRLVSVAARSAGSSEEYEQAKESLRAFGMGSTMENVFRSLGRRLPGWVVEPPAGSGAPAAPVTATARAMERMVTLEHDPREAARRFHELVQAAIEQFNEGSLARAVTMLDLAGLLLAEKKVDPAYVRGFREQAHAGLDEQRLREFAEEPATHALLQRVLAFFPALEPAGLLEAVKVEEKRERRHLLLALLEVHGPPARTLAAERLAASLASFGDRDAHFQRNLLYVLRRIPRADGGVSDAEVKTAIKLSGVGHPVMLIKEAVAYLAQVKDERGERTLINRVGEYESALLKPGEPGAETGDLLGVLDRAVFALARMGTPTAIRAVVHHGLKRLPQLGDTAARLAPLATVDLSSDRETINLLVQAVEAELPHKIFGFLLKKDWSFLLRLIEVLSASVRAQAVRNVLADMVQRFPGEEFAKAASKALAGAELPPAPPPPEPPQAASLSGDLELFGLPTLLQNLSQSTASGVLTITDALGEEIATVSLENGKFRDCRSGQLQGEVALFQLIERPTPASFNFVRRTPAPDGAADEPMKDLVPLFFEGTRRYDEFQQACMLVPDYACMRATGTKPTRPPEEEDAALVRAIWQRAASGSPALDCEKDIAVDSYRIRRMLAHWVEEGSLEPR
ncbi:MAG TPA: DUF4388 domain-containing protein [Thermoanaerobaculaceae bacterium]|nr:DUF4388 domain-containing protein [Thermoanaerobaculaceae bacterium]